MEFSDVYKLKAAKERETSENANDGGIQEPLCEPSRVDESIHQMAPSWEDEVNAANQRHRDNSPAKSDMSVQTIVDRVSEDDMFVMVCEHCLHKMDNGGNIVFVDATSERIDERPDASYIEQ